MLWVTFMRVYSLEPFACEGINIRRSEAKEKYMHRMSVDEGEANHINKEVARRATSGMFTS